MQELRTILACCAMLFVSAPCAIWAEGGLYDPDYKPTVDNPAFATGSGPLVLIDEAHNNYHTCGGRYHVLCELLENDGYGVESNKSSLSAEILAAADVLVIANALNEQNITEDENWKTPILPAFTAAEIEAVVEWVEGGGALVLISNHMPFPGAIGDMAARFGVVWQTAFAFSANFNFAQPKGDPNMITSG